MQETRLIKKVLLLLPILLVMTGFNYFMDPAGLFRGNDYYEGLAGILLKGNNISNLVNYDDRLLQKYLIEGLPEKKGIVLLGSSRVMQISSDFFPGHTFMNHGVAGASLEDDMAIYWLYRKQGLLPSTVIIGLDPWLLNKNSGQLRFESILREYQEISDFLHDSKK